MNGFIKTAIGTVCAVWLLTTALAFAHGMGGGMGGGPMMGGMGNGHHMMGGHMGNGMGGGHMGGGAMGGPKAMANHPMHQQMHAAIVARMYGTGNDLAVKKSTLMKELFATDLDGDKRISPAEYGDGPRAADPDRFAAMDGDADGYVTLDEMVAAQVP